MAFGWDDAAVMAANAAGSIWGGQGEQKEGNTHLVNQGAQSMWNQMARGLQTGQGDFGFGSNYKQGKSQVQDFMASRGVKMDPSSGAYAGMMGNMTGEALGMDADRRDKYAMQLMGTPMQTMTTTGANFLPNSPSRGSNWNAQEANYWDRNRDSEWTV